jgi:D-glycero-beta-D-manno-heptose 1-phosphate adenylyltransferase
MNIWTNGCFDILHSGHIDLLWFAKLYGVEGLGYHEAIKVNKLFVGLDSDERVKFLKGEKRPINDLDTRVKVMSNLKMVDSVVIFHDEEELEYFIKVFNIDYLVVGDQYKDKRVVGAEFAKLGVVFYPVSNGKSTTNIVEKIKNIANMDATNTICFNINYDNEVIKMAAHPYDIMTNKIMFDTHFPTPKFYEQEILEFIREKNCKRGGVALDIGANIGNHSIYFSKFIFDKVFAFEANPTNFRILLENKKLNNIGDDKLVVHNVALSDGYYNYRTMEEENANNMGGSRVFEGDGELITKKLDDFELSKVNFIKLDVERHELKVLKGAVNLINRDFPDIIVENETDVDCETMDLFMKELGYRMVEGFRGYGMFYYRHK